MTSTTTTTSSDDFPMNESQQRILQISVRISATISFIFATTLIYSVVKSKYYRQRIFHRIMMGCAINILVLNLNQLWGQAAVPAGTPGFPFARGNQATCTTQGFFFNMALVVPYYYVALSVLCLIAINNKFQFNITPISEVCIHIGVYILPIATSLYMLSLEAYNPSYSVCMYNSYPVGCGDQSDPDHYIECIRGPSNFGQISRLLGGLQIGVVCLLPTLIMSIIYFKVRLFQGRSGRQVAKSVAFQSIIYLVALYWTYIPKFIFWGITFKADKFVFEALLMTNIFEALQGVWFTLPYYYFRSSDPIEKLVLSNGTGTALPYGGGNNPSSPSSSERTKPVDEAEEKTVDDGRKSNNKNNHHDIDDSPTASPISSSASSRVVETTKKTSFSIFDGSIGAIDSNSPWAQYLIDDDGEDDSYELNGNKGLNEYDDTSFVFNKI